MSGRHVHLTGTDDRATPISLFAQLDAMFEFSLDVCASPENAKCAHWLGRQRAGMFVDGLTTSWAQTCRAVGRRPICWMNPPYGRNQLRQWLAKAVEETQAGVTTVALLPADSSTAWYHDYVLGRPTIPLRGRVTFDDLGTAAPFGSIVVIYHPPLVVSPPRRSLPCPPTSARGVTSPSSPTEASLATPIVPPAAPGSIGS